MKMKPQIDTDELSMYICGWKIIPSLQRSQFSAILASRDVSLQRLYSYF
ncbi:hypothetical protein N0Y54_15095 [Nostoc punctiforme UO1]